MNKEFEFTEYLEECFKRRKKPEERIYPKKDWPVGYEPTKKEYEEWMEEGTGVPVSCYIEDIGGGRKRVVFTPIKKNIEIVDGLGKPPGNDDQPANFQVKNSDGKLVKASKERLVEEVVNEKNDNDKKQVEKLKESLVYGAKGDIEGLTYFIERKGPDGVFKESYYQARSEEEKQQIRKRQEINMKRRELEKLQEENSPIVKQEPAKSVVQETNDNQEIKPITSQSSSLTSNSNHHNDSYFGTGALLVGLFFGVGLIGYGISLVIKKKNKQSR